MEEKNTSEHEQNDKKSWLEEQLQKRNLNQSEDTFTFKDDKETPSVHNTDNISLLVEPDTSIVKTELTQQQENASDTEKINSVENTFLPSEKVNTEVTKSENTEISYTEKSVSEPLENEVKEPVTPTKKQTTQPPSNIKSINLLSKLGQKKLFGQITVKKAVPYAVGGIVFVFLVFNLRYVIFNENKVPPLHNVNVKDTLLSDVSVTKVLDPDNPDKNDKKTTKKQENLSNNNEKNDNNKQNKETNNAGRIYYKVKQGDKFNDIARKHGLTPAELKELNPKVRPERIQPGQKLRVKKLD
jgi:LysM repeat protein